MAALAPLLPEPLQAALEGGLTALALAAMALLALTGLTVIGVALPGLFSAERRPAAARRRA